MDVELTEQMIQPLTEKVVQARAGDLSIYGLLSLLDELAPFAHELEQAKKKEEDPTSAPFTRLQQSVLDAEGQLGKAPLEVKKVLAEEIGRALKPGSSGYSSREQKRTLGFVEGQLRVAAKDTSEKGEKRCKMLRETRSELEACQVVKEPASVTKLESQLKKVMVEFTAIRKIYEAWEAGKKNFKTNDELQKTKRTYNELKKSVQDVEAAIDAELWKRRPAGAAPASAGAWAESTPERGSVGAAKPEPKKKAEKPPKKVKEPLGDSAGGDGGFWAAPEGAARGSAKDALKACLEEEDDINAIEKAQRPARMAPAKYEGMKQAKQDSKKRGQELLLSLRSEAGAPAHAPAVRRPAAVAGPTVRTVVAPMQAWGAHGTEDTQPQFAPAEWNATRAAAAAAAASPSHAAARGGGVHIEDEDDEEPDDDPALPPGWEAIWSEEHGVNYYWNTETDAVQWDVPEGPPRSTARAASAAAPRNQQVKSGVFLSAATVAAANAANEVSKVQDMISAKFGQRQKGGFWTEDADVPKLSFDCAIRAIAEELGLNVKEVRDLDVPSVEEWRINFTRQEWSKVRVRALALEQQQRQEAQRLERERAQRRLDKVSKTTVQAVTGGTAAKKTNVGGKAAPQQVIPGAGPMAPAAKSQPSAKKKGRAKADATFVGKVVTQNNRFAGMVDDSSDSD